MAGFLRAALIVVKVYTVLSLTRNLIWMPSCLKQVLKLNPHPQPAPSPRWGV
jgi:hypothetical protein